ncbi:hypothetical protein Droror1_Dr00014380 [Drosera rotundifolia]
MVLKQRPLAQTLVLSVSGMNNLEASNHHHVRNLMNHVVAYLVDLSGKNNLKNVAEMPETMLTLSCLLERHQGAASASEPQKNALYDVEFSVMDPVMTLLDVYKPESAMVYLLLKMWVSWVELTIILN